MQTQTLNLNGLWKVRAESLSCIGDKGYRRVRQARSAWIDARVPGEIHLDLMRAGQMEEPLVSTNAPKSRWPEKKSWWYRTWFNAPARFREHERQFLVFEGLDLYAQVFLNGQLLGESRNAFVPAVFDARSRLKTGRNELVVRLTSGAELAPPEAREQLESRDVYANRYWKEGIRWLRKPQFTYGWDWVDALPNIGIWRAVRLEGRSWVALNDLRLDTCLHGNQTWVRAVAQVDNLQPVSERACTLELTLRPPKGKAMVRRVAVDAQVGLSSTTVWLNVPDARLWWPNGMGEQPLYHVTARVLNGNVECDRREFDTGLRTVEIDRAHLRSGGQRFCIRVNGQDVFCKGGNWIPADAIIARVDKRKYDALIAAARQANMNILRVWGGGVYEKPEFYNACDRAGILVWHDFMFACNVYPDMEPSFSEAVKSEAEAVVRMLRHHPSIALWCGNNENHWFIPAGDDKEFAFGDYGMRMGGIKTYNYTLPQVCAALDPCRPYWPSSPCGGHHPNAETEGDCHWWHPFTMNPDINRRIRPEVFDECKARFVSEYGCIGPCHIDSVKQYLKPNEVRTDSRAWRVHTNTFEKETTPAAIRRHYADPEGLTLPEYILYGQMFQAITYGQSIEALRFRKLDPRDDCQGAIIWMFDDCWGEVGWTPIDYYLRRKPSYYWIRRACMPVKCIVRRRGTKLVTRVVNDTLTSHRADLVTGWMRVDGSESELRARKIVIPANGMLEALAEPIPAARDMNPSEWIYAAMLSGRTFAASDALWAFVPHRCLGLAKPPIQVRCKGDRIELLSPAYCHGVHVDDHGRGVLSDNYFDLLPGIPKVVARLDGSSPANPRFKAVMPKPT